MNKRVITKFVAKLVVSTAVGSLVTKASATLVPVTQNYKIAEMSGAVAGWYVGEKLEPSLNLMVDNFYNKREAK